MPANNFPYYQQSAPFWDWIASLEEQGSNHPFFARGTDNNNEQQQPQNPWAEGFAGFPGFPFGPNGFPFRPRGGRHGPHGRHHRGGPPPPPQADQEMSDDPPEQVPETEAGPSEPRGPPPPFAEEEHHRRHGSRHGSDARGRCGGRGRGGFGGRGRHGGPFGHPGFEAMGGFGELAKMFQAQLFGDNNAINNNNELTKSTGDFKPEVDVFDTADAFVVHISLPGAKKEDVGVNWDAEKSELSIAGVIYRPGDEELLKTLALDERKVGAFERKVRLGSRANPAQVDAEGISAKLEDGVLRVEVPKMDAGFVEIKKVDIE